MRKVIGIVGEGPTDYMVIREVIDHITGEANEYRRLQPEPDMTGRFGNGWKGVWRWCETNSGILDKVFHEVTPQLDLLVVQMDADVSRKEREVHCLCKSVDCEDRAASHPLRCTRLIEGECPVVLPCGEHVQSSRGYEEHLEKLIRKWLGRYADNEDILITIPCDSTDAWIVAAYQHYANVEEIENPWESVIARKKDYYGIRIPGSKKRTSVYSRLLPRLCEQWESVVEQCYSASRFDDKVKSMLGVLPGLTLT